MKAPNTNSQGIEDKDKSSISDGANPQVSSRSNGGVTGELDAGEVIEESDSEVITVREDRRNGCEGREKMKQLSEKPPSSNLVKTSTPVIKKSGSPSLICRRSKVGKYIRKAKEDHSRRDWKKLLSLNLAPLGQSWTARERQMRAGMVKKEVVRL